MLCESFGQRHRTLLRPFESQREGAYTAHREERFQCAGSGAGELTRESKSRQQYIVAHCDGAAEQVGMSADELRYGLYADVRTELEGPLVQWRRKGVVDAEDGTRLARGSADRVQVGDRQQRVRRRLEPDQVGRAAEFKPACRVRQG